MIVVDFSTVIHRVFRQTHQLFGDFLVKIMFAALAADVGWHLLDDNQALSLSHCSSTPICSGRVFRKLLQYLLSA